ncbi:MAG: hypothetical protein GY870_05760 [archaeon]|nr:hypothetical protein [archaeon]
MKHIIDSEDIKTAYFSKANTLDLNGIELKMVAIIRTFKINFPNCFIDGNTTKDLKFLNYNFRGFEIDTIHKYIGGEDCIDWVGPVRFYT